MNLACIPGPWGLLGHTMLLHFPSDVRRPGRGLRTCMSDKFPVTLMPLFQGHTLRTTDLNSFRITAGNLGRDEYISLSCSDCK